MSILNEIKRHQKFNNLWFDRDKLMLSLGIDITERKYMDLGNIDVASLSDLMMKSLMWMETLNEIHSTAKKMKMDEELEVDRVFNEVIKKLSKEVKATEAKAAAKTHEEYVASQKRYNTISAYVDYLDRLITNLDKYHYAIKGKIDSLRNVERKY